jgi:hypothetical protein
MQSYDNETNGDKEVPLRYRHYVKNWEPNPLPELDTDFLLMGEHIKLLHLVYMGWDLFYGWCKCSIQQ